MAGSPSERVHDVFSTSGLTLGCAESLTGGLVAAAVTDVAGSSAFFTGGIVSYWPSVKEDVLGVPASVTSEHGVVSRECAVAMADGAARVLGCDVAVSTTGIAGPGGAERGKPVGTVWIAVHTPSSTTARLLRATGDRAEVRRAAVNAALEFVLDALSDGA